MNRSFRDKELFEQIASAYAAKDIHLPSAIVRRHQLVDMVFKCLGDTQMGDVLEIGCGAGFAAQYLKSQYKSYTGIDHSTKMIEIANTLHKDLEDTRFISMDVQARSLSPLFATSVDTIICSGVLHHLENPLLAMKNVMQQAKPGGHFIALEPNNRNPIIQGLRFLRKKVDSSYSSDQKFYSPEELRLLLEQAGLTQINIRNEGYISPPFAQVIMRPAFIFSPLSRLALWCDQKLSPTVPSFLQLQSWNLVSHGRIPHH
jgi:2-polyprenyl-3-methyl-5-hydroxy-6-metoxy-1,4-benzoquinol methylase